MTRPQVHSILLGLLVEVQTAIDVPLTPITDNMKPLGDLPLFDSVLSEDTTVTLFQRLGIAPEESNPFVVNRIPQRISEIVNHLCKIVGVPGE